MAALQQAMLMVGGGPGLLDPFLTNLWSAYGLTRLVGAYTGAALRVRRSSDNAEQDIGFAGASLDWSALASFVGANSGYVTKWYDQSGAAHDMVQATAANQPAIVLSGVALPHIEYQATSHCLETSATDTDQFKKSMYFAGRDRSPSKVLSPAQAFDFSGNAVMASACADSFYNDAFVGIAAANRLIDHYDNRAMTVGDATVHGFVFDLTLAAASRVKRYINQDTLTTPFGGTAIAQWTTRRAYSLGHESAAPTDLSGILALQSFVIYEGVAHDAATAKAINALLAPTWIATPLNGRTSTLFIACALRKLLTAYAGPCLRVRRTSDDAQQDIGFGADGFLDVAAAQAFCAATDGKVVTWYDQSGGGNHMAQATAGNQPSLVSAGSVIIENGMPTVAYNSGAARLSCANATSGASTGMTVFVKAQGVNTSSAMVAQLGTGTVRPFYLFHNTNKEIRLSAESNAGADQSLGYYRGGAGYQILTARLDSTQATAPAKAELFSGPTKYARDTSADTGGLVTGNFASATWHLGASATGNFFNGFFAMFIVYQSALSDANINAYSRDLGS